MKIVIADHNRDSADSLALFLHFDGHDVQVCYDGRTAMRLILQWQPAVALLDLGMPGANGYEVAQEIRLRMPQADIKLVAVSGRGKSHEKAGALAAGFHEHRAKPVDPIALADWLAALEEEAQPPPR